MGLGMMCEKKLTKGLTSSPHHDIAWETATKWKREPTSNEHETEQDTDTQQHKQDTWRNKQDHAANKQQDKLKRTKTNKPLLMSCLLLLLVAETRCLLQPHLSMIFVLKSFVAAGDCDDTITRHQRLNTKRNQSNVWAKLARMNSYVCVVPTISKWLS